MANEQDKLDDLIQLVSFKLGQEEFGIDIHTVQEINRMLDITKIPQAPHYCEGVINLRGKVIPVIDLRKKFEMVVEEWTKSTRILVVEEGNNVVGVVVDAVEEVLRIPKSTIEPAPDIVSSVGSIYINGVAKLDERLLIFLNVARIIDDVNAEVNITEEAMA